MADRGRPRIVVRLAQADIDLIEQVKAELNSRRFHEPFTLASFVRSCIEERLAKIRRGRKPKAKQEENEVQP
jgi:hypothetical protein